MMLVLSLALALQVPIQRPDYNTSPPAGDTVGYWQQRVAYRMTATLDEERGLAHGVADLTYVNQSPDTLRELYVHQHLNAFRPGSAWSRADEREGRLRFQRLADPEYAYERFTATPTIDGVAVAPRYPGAPDSTVVVFTLPRPLAPADSIRVHFEWDARPSTLPRRQGRRGRRFDFAQWYPRVAVYDRGGWQPNPLVPAGEFYGEFGSYDVTVVVPQDQVIGATGVPVDGDPGWQDALRHGAVHRMADAYGDVGTGPDATIPPGFKRVRFVARDVHHFAWSISPEYRYEGGAYVRSASARFPTWDTVAIHVLYQPGDEPTWGDGIVVGRTIAALRWLESVYGPYGYPQMTVLHRIEGGGTEFPMMQMNGSPSQGLILHEGGHIFTHGILANNEWRSGWLDEGLTSYQTAWATRSTPQDRPLLDSIPAVPRPDGYRGQAVRPDIMQAARMDQQRQVFTGRAEPLGTRADEFNEFGIYNSAVYTRAEIMYGALREVLGDSAFRAFLRDYYARWAFKHVDERALRASAERVSGQELDWFFDQWVRGAGNVDYALTAADVQRQADGRWVTRARVERRGEYAHPMPIGVRTTGGWTVQRTPLVGGEVTISTASEPLEVRLDPYQTTYDWDRRNDVLAGPFATAGRRQLVFDWPFLEQAADDRQLLAWRPWAMYSAAGGYALGARVRSNYQGWIDRSEIGFATSLGWQGGTRRTSEPGAWRNLWFAVENPSLWRDAPVVGLRLAAWHVDDAVRFDVGRTWDASRFLVGPRSTRSVSFTTLATNGLDYLPSDQWEDATFHELTFAEIRRTARADSGTTRLSLAGGRSGGPGFGTGPNPGYYARVEFEGKRRHLLADGTAAFSLRLFAGHVTRNARLQRQFRLSAQDPVMTFGNHFLRSDGAPLEDSDGHYLQLGGGGLRGFGSEIPAQSIAAANMELGRLLLARNPDPRALRLWLNAFADAALADVPGNGTKLLADAGVGLALRGMFYDQPIRIRLDAPIVLSDRVVDFAGIRTWRAPDVRWTLSFTDLW